MKNNLKFLQIGSGGGLLFCALLFCGLLFFGAIKTVQAVEIPLDNLERATKIAYVDMHKIFEVFPETEKARRNVTRTVQEKKSEITLKKEEVARLKGEVDFLRQKVALETVSTATVLAVAPLPAVLPSAQVQQSTVSAALAAASVSVSSTALLSASSVPVALPNLVTPMARELAQKEELLSKREVDLEAFVGGTEQEIAKLEEGRNMEILAQIYRILQETASRSGYTIVLDKDNILYGQNTVDITDLVIKKLQQQ